MNPIIVVSEQEFHKHLQENTVAKYHYQTAAGNLVVFATQLGIVKASFEISSEDLPLLPSLSIPLIVTGTPLQVAVWNEVSNIKAGQKISYAALASSVGKPKAVRAVANALAQNKIAYFIPCHRVIRSDETISGYRWGADIKRALLAAELGAEFFIK